ncbi:hypothetical protein [Streptomyces sp. NPDC004538]|uniref:hypothetical protein n=1 Tax=Streptomyces sp. NPDC004538 TaxID=3154279 RepID=UPI00339DBC65
MTRIEYPAVGERPRAQTAKRLPEVVAIAAEQDATRTGLVPETRARFGFTAAPGTIDE